MDCRNNMSPGCWNHSDLRGGGLDFSRVLTGIGMNVIFPILRLYLIKEISELKVEV